MKALCSILPRLCSRVLRVVLGTTWVSETRQQKAPQDSESRLMQISDTASQPAIGDGLLKATSR